MKNKQTKVVERNMRNKEAMGRRGKEQRKNEERSNEDGTAHREAHEMGNKERGGKKEAKGGVGEATREGGGEAKPWKGV